MQLAKWLLTICALLMALFWFAASWVHPTDGHQTMWDPSSPMPFWFWALLAACGAGALFLWFRRDRTPGPGCCHVCGYNLTGNVSGRCPECGAEIGQSQRPSRGAGPPS